MSDRAVAKIQAHRFGSAHAVWCRQTLVRGAALACAASALLVLAASGAAAQQVVRIGLIGPLTGTGAAMGHSQLTGAEMRVKEVNAAGKLKIELLPEDDASQCDQSVNAAVKLITQNKVAAILGAINSPCALAIVPITRRYKVPQFTIGVGTAITKQGSEWIFRAAVGAVGQTQAIADYAVKEMKLTKIAVLYADDEYGASMANSFKDALAQHNVAPVAFETFPRGDQDFTGQLLTVKRSGATALYTTGAYTASALIAKQARQLGLELRLLGDQANASPRYIELGGDAVEGAVLVEPFTPADPDPKIQAFVQRYRAEFKREPDGWVAAMYDVIGMVEAAVTKSGKADPAAIRDYVAGLATSTPYEGVLGKWQFDKTGEALFPLYKVEIKGGKKVILTR